MKSNVRSAALSALSVLAVLFLVLAPAVPALAQSSSKPIVIHPSHYGLSRPLRDLVAEDPYGPRMGENTILFLGGGPALPGSGAPAGEDKALQREALPLVVTSPGLNFEAVNSLYSVAPPDTNGAVRTTTVLA